MGKNARKYSAMTIKRLFALSGNCCAFPGCEERLVNQKNALDSNICHIEGANEGSQRYNSNMDDKDRASYDNLILLCRQHHDVTNDTDIYTVDDLVKMKRDHESQYLTKQLRNKPSMLSNTINAISSLNLDTLSNAEPNEAFDPSEKLSYNNIKTHYTVINEYKVFHKKLNDLYEELEIQGSIKKDRLLDNIRSIYIDVRANYVKDSDFPIDIIRANSDRILDDIHTTLYERLIQEDLFEEDIILGIRLVMTDAFIRCKIMEHPNDSK